MLAIRLGILFLVAGTCPRAYAQGPFLERAAQHPALGAMPLRSAGTCAGFELVVQVPAEADEGFLAQTKEGFLPWLEAIDRILREDFLVPAGLEPRPSRLPVVLLASEQDYDLYRAALDPAEDPWLGAHWDATLGAIVGHQDSGRNRRPPYRQRGPVLREAVRGRLAAHCPAGVSAPGSEWFVMGLAQAIGHHVGRTPDCLPDPMIGARLLRPVHQLLRYPESRKAYWLDLEALLGPKNRDELAALPKAWVQRTYGGERTVDERYIADFDGWFRTQSQEWLRFLLHGAEGRHAVHLPTLLAEALRGELDAAGLVAVLEVESADALVGQFHDHLDAAFQAKLRLPPVARPKKPVGGSRPGAVAETLPTPAPPFDPATLTLEPESPYELIGFALHLAADGRYNASLELLTEHALEVSPEEAAEIERTRERVGALRLLRDAWIQQTIDQGGSLRMSVDGKLRAFKPKARGEEHVQFQSNRHGVTALALTEFTPELLLLNVKRKWERYSDPATLALAQFLVGDVEWERSAGKAGAAGAELLRDLDNSWAMLATGAYLREVRWLAQQDVPDNAEASAALFERLVRARSAASNLPIAASHLPACRDYGHALLMQRAKLLGLQGILQGSVEDLGAGQLRITYDFSSSQQLKDFTVDRSSLTKRLSDGELGIPPEEPSAVVENGALQLIGRSGLMHSMHLEGAVSVRFRCGMFSRPAPATRLAHFIIGAHWTPETNRIFAAETGRGLLVDFSDTHQAFHPTPDILPPLESVDEAWIELRFDGDQVYSVHYSGFEERRFWGSGGPQAGQPCLAWATAYTVCIEDLVIEGTARETHLVGLYSSWANQQLEASGF